MAKGIVVGGLNSGGSNIKSIQRGTASMISGAINIDVPISSVDLNKAIVLVTFRSLSEDSNNNFLYYFGVKAKLTTSTNLNLKRYQGPYQSLEISWTVVEFNNVKSIQRGSLTSIYTSKSDVVTISPVDMSKSLLFFSYTEETGNNGIYYAYVEGVLTNPTTITFTKQGMAKTYEWQVIEFN